MESLKDVLAQVLALQPLWTSTNTPEMKARGELIRHAGPNALRMQATSLAKNMNLKPDDLLIEGRDGTGPRSEIPWFRFASRDLSPGATDGWYCVYLFRADGSAAYLSLMCGSTRWDGSTFVPRDESELQSLTSWAQTIVGDRLRSLSVSSKVAGESMDLRAARGPLGKAYELSNAFAIQYPADNLPSSEELLADAQDFALLLGDLYEQVREGEEPGSLSPEAVEATASANRAAGRFSKSGTGFRRSATHRRAIELAAMQSARAWLESDGWTVVDRSSSSPFDFECKREGVKLYVEVKGTTSRGSQIVLTRNEVLFHQDKFPQNALIIVSKIEVNESGVASTSNASVRVVRPWAVEAEKLQVISYTYDL